jgi:hypothetical protein
MSASIYWGLTANKSVFVQLLTQAELMYRALQLAGTHKDSLPLNSIYSSGTPVIPSHLDFGGSSRVSEDVRILVEIATLAGAVVGSGKRFSLRRVAFEENIPD